MRVKSLSIDLNPLTMVIAELNCLNLTPGGQGKQTNGAGKYGLGCQISLTHGALGKFPIFLAIRISFRVAHKEIKEMISFRVKKFEHAQNGLF